MVGVVGEIGEAGWETTPPLIFEVVTGFFPETKPKPNWSRNPRPLLVCGVATDEQDNKHFVRIAYGTKNVSRWGRFDLTINNLSALDALGLPNPTRFVLDAKLIVVMPWSAEHFRPWRGYVSPRIGRLEEDAQRFVSWALKEQFEHLPKF